MSADELDARIDARLAARQTVAGTPGGAAPAQAPGGQAGAAPAIDMDQLAAAIVRQMGGVAGGGQAAGAQPGAGAQGTPGGARAPTMLELLAGMGAQPGQAGGGQGLQQAPRVGVPRKVNNLEQDGGFVDVFSLSEDEVNAMPIEKLVEHFERARNAARTATGAPPLPKALRGRQATGPR